MSSAVSRFFGREQELAALAGLLAGERLVTLTGPPGIGKTRLAMQVAAELAGTARFVDGACVVELAACADAALVPAMLAAAMSVSEVAGQSVTEALAGQLRRRRMLVVLDNCEHLIGACAALADALVRACPELVIVATSREALAVTGERVWQVPPLPVPAAGEQRPEAVMASAAARLFVDRAQAAKPAFALTGEVAAAVTEITRRLDGVALAIELAAARVAVLTPAEIAARLDDRFALLTRGSRSDLPHHQTLQAALSWSHDLLSPPEQTLLRRVSVFAGGFCLQGAEAVAGDRSDAAGDDAIRADDVLDLLAGLVAKSLVSADTADARGRYRLLETIRAYAGDRLHDAGETHARHQAHARFYLAMAERAEPELTGPHQDRWLERLETERENLRLALAWSLEHEPRCALRLAGALILFWRVRCHFSEGRDLLQAALTASPTDTTGPHHATARWGTAFMTMMAGDPTTAIPIAQHSLDAFRRLRDQQGEARALLILGQSEQSTSQPGGLQHLERSAALARSAGDSWCLAHALGAAGYTHMALSDCPPARPLFEECVAVARKAQDKQGLRFGLTGLGSVALGQGDYETAESLGEETLAIASELGEEYWRSLALVHLGQVAFGRGDHRRARELLEEAGAALPDLAPMGAFLGPQLNLALVAHAEGNRRRARWLFEDALARIRAQGTSIPALLGLAELAAAEQDDGRARSLFDEVLDRARCGGNRRLMAEALHGLGQLSRGAGDLKRATTLHNEALELRAYLGDAPGAVAGLEAVAGLAVAAGRHHRAARLFGATQALRERWGFARAPWEAPRCEADMALVNAGLHTAEIQAAWTEGSAMSIEEALIHATKGRRRRGRPASGWPSLTETEQQVATLVAENLTNRQIAGRLLVSPGTVKAHLSHIFSKLGLSGRRELAQEVWQRRQRLPATEEIEEIEG